MILKEDYSDKYLEKVHNGEISLGKGIGVPKLDEHLRYKQGQFNIINGLDNVGKTVWMMWYFLNLATRHGIKFCIWSGENKSESLIRQLIEWLEGKKIKDIPLSSIYAIRADITSKFKFIDPSGFYTNKDVFELFKESKADACLIDPFTGLNRQFSHAANYEFLNETRNFVNSTGITIYVNTHPNTEAARRIYPSDDKNGLAGYPMPPSRSQSEGGQPFANRVDDFITIHRLIGHPDLQFNTQVFVRKVKDTETGGIPNGIDDPINFEWNKGLGFTCDGINPLGNIVQNDYEFQKLEINRNFDNEFNETPF
jgi:hypothetical protein